MLIRSRRPKRNRYLQIGLFFIIYTCYHAYSAAVDRGEDSTSGESLGTTETTPNFTATENPVEVVSKPHRFMFRSTSVSSLLGSGHGRG